MHEQVLRQPIKADREKFCTFRAQRDLFSARFNPTFAIIPSHDRDINDSDALGRAS